MLNNNHLSTVLDEQKVKEKLQQNSIEWMKKLNVAHKENRFVYVAEFVKWLSTDEKDLPNYWKTTLSVLKSKPALYQEYQLGKTNIQGLKLAHQFSPSYQRILPFLLTYTHDSKTSVSPNVIMRNISDNNLNQNAFMLMDCQVAIVISQYGALYQTLQEELGEKRADEVFDQLFDPQFTPLYFSRYNVMSGTLAFCYSDNDDFNAPYNPLSFFMSYLYDYKIEDIETGAHVYLMNHPCLDDKQPLNSDSGRNAIADKQDELKLWVFSTSDAQTEEQIKKSMRDTYNQEIPKWTDSSWVKNSLYYQMFNNTQRKSIPQKITEKDVPGLQTVLLVRFDEKEVCQLIDAAKNEDTFKQYIESYRHYIESQKLKVQSFRQEWYQQQIQVQNAPGKIKLYSSVYTSVKKKENSESESKELNALRLNA